MKTFMLKLRCLPLLTALALVPPAIASAQSGSFIIAQHGHSVGAATVTFTPNPNGYDTTTVIKVAMQGLNYDLSKSEQLTSANALKHVQLSATVNSSAVNITAAPDAAQLLLNISANGHSTTTRLARHAAAVFMPDFDPGALDTLLALGVARNNAGLWAIIPKGAGSISPIQLATYADEQGTIDGKPVNRFREVERAVQKPQVDVTVWRDGSAKTLQLKTVALSGRGIDRILIWAGATLQAPHRAMAAQRGIAPYGVFVSFFF